MRVIAFLYIVVLLACGQKTNKLNLNPFAGRKPPVVLDSLSTTENLYKAQEIRVPSNFIAFIGQYADTIRIKQSVPLVYNFISFEGDSTHHYPAKDELQLIVNENQLLSMYDDLYPAPPPLLASEDGDPEKALEIGLKRQRNCVRAIPVFIVNTSNDTLLIDHQDERVIMIQEAKDELGNWKPIEYWLFSSCGNSYGYVSLPPKQLALIKVTRYSGNFRTQMRLKLRNRNTIFYSNIFTGYINKKQFELPSNATDSITRQKFENKDYFDRAFLNKK